MFLLFFISIGFHCNFIVLYHTDTAMPGIAGICRNTYSTTNLFSNPHRLHLGCDWSFDHHLN